MVSRNRTRLIGGSFGCARRRPAASKHSWMEGVRRVIRFERLEERQMMSGVSPTENALALMPLGLVADSYEVDNSMSQARTIATNGGTQTHNLLVGSDVDWVKFTIGIGSNVVVETSGSAGDTEMRLYNSAGTQLAYDDDSGYNLFSRIALNGLAAGTYYARVNEYGSNNAISAYNIRVTATDVYESDNTMSQARTIVTNGGTQTHSLHVGSDVDWVKFTIGIGSNVVVETSGSAGDTELRLYNSAGTQLAYDDDSGYNLFSRIALNGLAAGTYYARVNEYGSNNAISAYNIRVTATDVYESDNTMSQARTIATNGATQTHNLHVGSDVDWVKFTIGIGSNVVVETSGPAGDTELRLYNSAGTQLAYDDDSGYNLFSRIALNGLAAGTYYARVNEWGGNDAVSAYTIQVTVASVDENYLLFSAWGGSWSDADKSIFNTEDDLMCWAATGSNMLQWTGWGRVAGMTTADAMFQYFQNHWTDEAGHQRYGCDWWFDGTNNTQGWPGWSQVDVPGGGFFPGQSISNYIHWSDEQLLAMDTITSYLRSGYAVGLGLSGGGGHAITCWGYSFSGGATNSYAGIWVTDSDDNQDSPSSDNLRYYRVSSSSGRWYLQDYYGTNSWYISDVTGLARRPAYVTGHAATAAAFAVAPVGMENLPVVRCVLASAADELFGSEDIRPSANDHQAALAGWDLPCDLSRPIASQSSLTLFAPPSQESRFRTRGDRLATSEFSWAEEPSELLESLGNALKAHQLTLAVDKIFEACA